MRAGISEWIFFSGRQGVSNQNLSQQQISVHSVTDNLSHLRIFELNEGISFGPCCLFRTGNFDTQDIAVLTEVRFELFFEESVRQMAHIDNSVLIKCNGYSRPSALVSFDRLFEALKTICFGLLMCLFRNVDLFSYFCHCWFDGLII